MNKIPLLFIITILNISFPLYSQEMAIRPTTTYSAPYNLETVDTISGTIYKIGRYPVLKGRFYMSYLILSYIDPDGYYKYLTVHLGPSFFMDNQKIKLKEMDEIDVTGSFVPWKNKQILVASEIVKGNKVIKLRDEKGIPVWNKR